jgi:tetratricopeptide (TPR) repeat protein
MMEGSGSCSACGGPLADGGCQTCDRGADSRFIHREIVALILLGAVVVIGFVVTRAAARANRELRLMDAARWYEAGERAIASGRTGAAIPALRRAASIDRDRREYRVALAGALMADRQDEAARQILLGLREANPEDPEINLRLARLHARRNDLAGAVRYYQNALYGVWTAVGSARRQVRIELIRGGLH